jgi:hypothetical protein
VLKEYDDLECYYLVGGGVMGLGWIHNTNAWTLNNYYLAKGSTTQNFLGCTSPAVDTIVLPGFAEDHDFYVSWFPTRMNGLAPESDTIHSTMDGNITLDFSDLPMNGVANNYLDTLHSDYAFVVATYPVPRSMVAVNEVEPLTTIPEWDFIMFPNPANDVLHVQMLPSSLAKDVALYDMSGKRVYSRTNLSQLSLDVPLGTLAKGAYCVRISDETTLKMKTLIIQ